jgi:flagellar biosynthetic protein FliQ
MEIRDVVDVMRDAIGVLLTIGAPMMLTALFVGLLVSLVQALTQIQEMTLTFVPKLIAILLVMAMALPFMLQTLADFGENQFAKIATLE